MSAQNIADNADMIVAGYAYTIHEDYIEVIDLSDLSKRAILQNGDVVESMMSDEEDDVILNYYLRNKEILEAANA
mgnify:FL=1